MRAIAGLIFGLCAFGAAQAADLNDPVWDRAPGQDDWAKAYPTHAAQAGITGAVKMKCAATSAGMLSDCSVIQETPTGEGFGAAALSLATGMALKPTDSSGHAVTGRNLIVPVRFDSALLHNPGTIVGQPDWLRKPTNDEMVQFFPAKSGGVAGSTMIGCVVSTRGLLEKCAIKSEEPVGHGFGAAALAMSTIFMMRPMTVDGSPVGGASVSIPIHFEGDTGGNNHDTLTVARAAPWMSAPTADQLSQAFPKSAIGKTASAHVVMRCAFRDDGGLKDCEAISETPYGRGFAEAARSLTKSFRGDAAPQRDKLPNLRIDLPFDFRDPSQPTPPIEVYDPIWLKRVNPQYVATLFPAAAVKAGLRTGKADVECSVQHDGTLKDCAVASEAPAGMGFGDAALKVAAVVAMNPWTAQGDPVDGARIRLPVRLELPADAAAPAASAQPATAKP
jgi:outer membrane biosynthesis protein TonB